MSTKALAGKTMLGFAQLVLGLGILLFAPAGTFDFRPGWVYLLLFAACSAAITAYLWRKDPKLLERRVRAGPGAEQERSQKLIQVFASLAFLALLIVPALDRRFAWSHVPLPFMIAGDVLVVLGFLLVFNVFRANSFTAATIEVATGQRVISTGPYAIVRHPMYAGALVMLLGTPLALGSWWGLLAVVPMFVALAWRLLDEESFLSMNLDGYSEYRRQVHHRLVPFIW